MNVQDTISNIVDSLKQIDGVSTLVLGGSRARGAESPNSDIDIGIYYDSDKGLDISGLRRVAAALDDDRRDNLVTEIGEWGPWINGGGWLKVNQIPVDFLFRDQNKVSQVIEQCVRGDITIDYQPGHPHGFVNSIYFAEIALCKVLWDPSGVVGKLKHRTIPFPPAFQKAISQKFFWEAAFSLDNGYKGIYKKDLSYIAGCCFRSVSCLNQVLFAINETYLMNEKGATAIADSLDITPNEYSHRINELYGLITEDQDCLKKAFSIMHDLIQETESLLKTKSLLN
ncbi:nucleotidyltransferase domain-containing protein [Paenibacillus chitinolyticus]|uniref:nucleotidyltransferase domain-containing protein n=1 Tax=Paenibacillus chitinolyticus TaxID=79263 RepID=UPI001C44F66B|nr:nucleotidyltransferase domain-containing protein [Paenibacillus chitinolyticus]MBV6717401.1 nucleotidyltransferase domain-containing protein [Paenibacillus chitinolyticus]